MFTLQAELGAHAEQVKVLLSISQLSDYVRLEVHLDPILVVVIQPTQFGLPHIK